MKFRIWNLHLGSMLILALTASGFAQEPAYEYGKPEEMAGLTKVFVSTGLDVGPRNNIIREIQKKLPKLIFTDSAEEADLFLSFGSSSEPAGVVTTTRGVPGTDTRRSQSQVVTEELATGYVATFPAPGRVRILMSFKDTRSNLFERKTTTNFARAFVKAYLEAEKAKAELQKNPYYRMLTGQDKKPD